MHRLICALGVILVASLVFGGPIDTAEAARSATNAPTTSTDAARVAPDRETPSLERSQAAPVYGPILSRDPATRAQIKRLYIQQTELTQGSLARLDELSARLRTETDPDFRYVTNQEIGTIKRDLERDHIELGLQIARLNGDERRVAEYELALDQILHPEKYRPERTVDPALEEERMRQLGRN